MLLPQAQITLENSQRTIERCTKNLERIEREHGLKGLTTINPTNPVYNPQAVNKLGFQSYPLKTKEENEKNYY